MNDVNKQSFYSTRHTIANAFNDVVDALAALLDSYETSPMAMWSHTSNADYNWLARVLFDLWYHDGQKGNQSRQHVGLVGATQAQLERVAAVNLAKHHFESVMASMKSEDRSAQRAVREGLEEVAGDRRDLLGYTGLGRLHLKQTWRQLPTVETRCRLVSFSWYVSGRSIYRRSVADVEKLLADLHNDSSTHIRIQRERLASLPSSEPLAQVQRQAPIMRANTVYETPTATLKTRRMFSISMPLFVPLEAGELLPEITAPETSPPTERVRPIRSDVRLESEPFLPSLHIYRYINSGK